MDVKFDFEYEGQTYFGHVYQPIAKVSFKSPQFDTWITSWMVVDTGADFTILPKFVSKDLGISLEKDCVVDTTKGVGGEETIYLCKKKIEAKIGNTKKIVPIAFFDNDEVPALLGRLGFMETFDTEFLKSRAVVFKD